MPINAEFLRSIGKQFQLVVLWEGRELQRWPGLKEGSCAVVASTPHIRHHLQVPQRLTGELVID